MFPITMTIHNPTQLNAVLAALSIEQPVPAPAAVVKEAKPEATAKKPDGAAQTAETKPTATTAAAESSQSVAAETGMTAAQATEALHGHAEQPAPSYQETAAAVTALAKAQGRAAAMEVLRTFGVEKLPDAKPEQFAAIIAAAVAALEG